MPETRQACHLLPCTTWKPIHWSPCSVTCGSGIQTRSIACTRGSEGNVVDEYCCDRVSFTALLSLKTITNSRIPVLVKRRVVRKIRVKDHEFFRNFKQMFLQFDGQLDHGQPVQPLVEMEHNAVFSSVAITFVIFLTSTVVIWTKRSLHETVIFVIVHTGRLLNGKNVRLLVELMFNRVEM